MDGSKQSVDSFNKALDNVKIVNVKAINAFLTTENIENTIIESGLPPNIDILSIDVDGNDYWLWDRIHYLSPRIVIIEYNASLGNVVSWATPYDPAFDRFKKHPSGFYCSASLEALHRLGEQKGYKLVGCESGGVNAFFVRSDCLPENLLSVSTQEAYRPHKSRLARGFSSETQFDLIKDLPYVSIP